MLEVVTMRKVGTKTVRKYRRWRSSFYGLVLLMAISATAWGQQEGPPANFTIDGLVQGHLHQVSSIRNMHVKYSEDVVHPDSEAIKKYSGDVPQMVRHMRLNRLEEGDKYRARFSKSPGGFDDANSIVERSYDGSVSMVMWPAAKAARIMQGLENETLDKLNSLTRYIMAVPLKVASAKEAVGLTDFEEKLRRPPEHLQLRPIQENVNGEWCHVVDVYLPDGSGGRELQYVMHVAADKGCLPVKCEMYRNGKIDRSVEMANIREIATDTGKMWFPTEIKHKRIYAEGDVVSEIKIEAIEVNLNLTQDDFRLKFPVGTRVNDTISQTQYKIEFPNAPLAGLEMLVDALKNPEAQQGKSKLVQTTQPTATQPATSPRSDMTAQAKASLPPGSQRRLLGTVSWIAIAVGAAGIILWVVGKARQNQSGSSSIGEG